MADLPDDELTGCECRWHGKEWVRRCALHDGWHQQINAARVLAELAKTAPGRLPQRMQDAIATVDAHGVGVPDGAQGEKA